MHQDEAADHGIVAAGGVAGDKGGVLKSYPGNASRIDASPRCLQCFLSAVDPDHAALRTNHTRRGESNVANAAADVENGHSFPNASAVQNVVGGLGENPGLPLQADQ